MRKLYAEQEKKKHLYEVMLEQYKAKNELRVQYETAEQKELEKIAQYQSRLDQRNRQQKLENARKEKEKEAIYLKLKAA
jgi:hypothetical protein